jgi:mRNA interferase MazF
MPKDYLKWYRLKAEIHSREFTGNFSEREIWWCSIGVNIGMEQDGKHDLFERPVLVLRKFGKHTFFGVPLSSKVRLGSYYFPTNFNGHDGILLLTQGRSMSSKRLQRRLGKIAPREFLRICEAFDAVSTPKKSDPQQAESPRAPDGELYQHYSKHNHKSQGI